MLHYDLNLYGSATSYAFTQMILPAFGAALKIEDGRHYFARAAVDVMAANRDPNGGVACVLSLRAGKGFDLDKHVKTSVFVEYQHLQYGALYNNGVGGGVSATITYHRFFVSGTAAALYGMSGDVGYHLLSPGNDFIFSGKLGYRFKDRFAPYLFITQERYIGSGNALTSQSVGAGIKYRF